jgi:glycosyltransferase involved in cell wall biosynthesis
MRILHVLHSHGYGGAENHAVMLMKGQRAAGHEVMYAGPVDSWIGQACQAEGIEAVHIGMHGLADLVSHVRLRHAVRRWDADIVHGHLIRGAMYAGWAGYRHRRPVAICTAHATTARTHMQRCAHIIAVSGAVRDSLLQAGYAPEGVTVIHNGVPDGPAGAATANVRGALRADLGIPDHVLAVVNAGRFVPDKGQELLLQAMAHWPADVHLYLIGDPDTDYGRRVRQVPHDASRVHFLGYRKDVPRILPAFDIYALSSHREALGLSLIEAFASSLPVVATAVGGVPEIVLQEETGLLVPAGDAAALGKAVARLHGDPALMRALAARGRQYFEQNLTVERMVEQTLAVYTQALQRGAA